MAGEWDRLREFDGSVENAFEELCAQVARIDSEAAGHRFVRNGKPDGGLECYSIAPDGGVRGWQAKWFRTAPTPKQWAQVTDSYKNAVAKYPQLRQFVVCLPQDRGTSGGKSAFPMERWRKLVAAWKAYASKRDRSIAFDFWGTSEMFARLTTQEQAGRHKFWFDRDLFPPTWFRERFEEARENNKRRYRPDLDFDLPINSAFEPLLQTRGHIDSLRKTLAALNASIENLGQWPSVERSTAALAGLVRSGERISEIVERLPRAAEVEPCEEDVASLLTVGWNYVRTQPEPLDRLHAEDKASFRHWYRCLHNQLSELHTWVSEDGIVRRARTLVLIGDAGQGKTHALLRCADRGTLNNDPMLLGFGINFSKGDLWDQLIRSWGLTATRDEVLGALNAAGEAAQARTLIAIDALNESDDPTIWKSRLGGMLVAVKRYPFIAIAVSVRSEFARDVLPDGVSGDQLPVVEHTGFQGLEPGATARIFQHFGLATPEIPLLEPEFSSPLFVITLAESLSRSGQRSLPQGAQSLRWVFELWLGAVNEQLSAVRRLDYDVADNRVQRAAVALAGAMAGDGAKWLKEERAKAIVDQVHRSDSWSKSLYRALLDEDVLQRVFVFDAQQDARVRAVRFTYDRLTDHLVARFMLQRPRDIQDLARTLRPRGRLRRLIVRKRGQAAWLDPGLLLALAIEIPEDTRFSCELSTVFPSKEFRSAVHRAILESVHWRRPDTIGPRTVDLVRREWRSARTAPIEEQAGQIERLLRLATRVNHPLNAEFLDSELRLEPMPERDYWWSRPMTQLDEPAGVVTRLIEWMWTPAAGESNQDAALLCAITAAWLFATSNRFIRDRATKALVSLLQGRPSIAANLFERFCAVDDPYVVERVLAVAYGVALRTRDLDGLGVLARCVYRRCFHDGQLPEHLLSRDYARGVVETATRRSVLSPEELDSLRPPYESSWPAVIASHEQWDARLKNAWESEPGLCRIWSSVGRDGDFGRYVIGHNNWLRYRLGEALPRALTDPTHDDPALRIAEDYVIIAAERANAEQRESEPDPIEYATPDGPPPSQHTRSGRPLTRTELRQHASFPETQIQCMVMDDVIALGYASRLDDGVRPHDAHGDLPDRIGSKSERMGKKYQWIAFMRTQARVADHFRFGRDPESAEQSEYHGPWQLPHGRDIDPSCLLRARARLPLRRDTPTWWAPFNNTMFDRTCDDLQWIKDTAKVPTLAEACEAIDPVTQRPWIVGSRFVHLSASRPVGLVPEHWRRRDIWYHTLGALVRRQDGARLVNWLNAERRRPGCNGHDLLPEAPHLHDCFLWEFPNSPAWDAENWPYWGRAPWSDGYMWRSRPGRCSLLADGYFDDDDLDCSRDEVLEFSLPSAELVQGLRLRHADSDGHFEDGDGRLVAWDPSITQPGPMALLLDRDALLSFAVEKGYHILLFVYGEQGAYSESTEYLGRLLFSGAFVHDGSQWRGSIDARFAPPTRSRKQSRSRETAAPRAGGTTKSKSRRPRAKKRAR